MPQRSHHDLVTPRPQLSGDDIEARILHITSLRIVLAPSAYYPNGGGIEALTRRLARALAANGHCVTVLTNRWPAGKAGKEMLNGVQVTRRELPWPASNPAAAARCIARGALAAARPVPAHPRRGYRERGRLA